LHLDTHITIPLEKGEEMRSDEGRPRKRRSDWVYCVLPAAVASGPIGTLVQLYIMTTNGPGLGTIYAGVAVAAFNFISIPAAMFWGFATDRLHKRKWLIVVGYAVTAVVLFSFYFEQSTPGAIATYSLFSFVSSASATPLNLLIMETEEKGRWAGTFARLSMMSSIGNTAGLVLSTVWSSTFRLILLTIPLGVFSLISAGLALTMISEPKITLEREAMILRKPSFFSRLLALPLIFLTVPSAEDFRRIFRGLRYSVTSQVPLLYISIVLFYLSSGVFNTSLVPALYSYSLSHSEVFAVILAGMFVQTFSFQYAGRYVSRRSLAVASLQGLVLRGVCYVMLGVFALFAAGPLFVVPTLILYPLAAGVAFAVYYTASNTMIFNTVQHRNAGSTLGVYSAVVGVANTVGSFISGFTSVYLGFHATFMLGGALLGAAALVMVRLRGMEVPSERGTQVAV
jgi:MFS family permease